MASFSSNPSPGPAMANGGGSENPMADVETVAGDIDGKSIDPSRFSPVPEDDRESFIFPLFDPWYDNGDNFPGDMQPVPIDFEFPCSASADWAHWVADEFLDADFCGLLEQAGVAEAILLSRSCNMYRDTEMLWQILRRWCASTHTFFFSWGEFTITLEDVENHWMLPVLGDMDSSAGPTTLSTVPLSSPTGSIGNKNSQRREKFRNMSRHILSRYPDLKVNLPLVYRWVGLRVKDPDLVPSLDFEECTVWRPYSYSYACFSCHSILYWFSDIASQNFELLPDDKYRGSLVWTKECQEYWLKVAAAMADYVDQGRGTRIPLPNHHTHPVESVTLSPPTQTAISYADRQNLGFAEWDELRGGSKKVYSSRSDPSSATVKPKPKSPAKTPSKRPKVAINRSMIPLSELGDRSLIALGTSKKSAVKTSKVQKKLDVGSQEESAVGPPIPSKEAVALSFVVQKKPTPPPNKAWSKSQSKSTVALKKAKGKSVEKSTATPSSSGEESLVVSTTPFEKRPAIPVPSGTMYDRTRSKRNAAVEQAKSKELSGDDDVIDTGVEMTEVDEGIVEWEEMALEITGDVTTKDEATPVMADEAVYETAPIMADEISIGLVGEAHVGTAYGIAPVVADEASAGAVDEACAGTALEIVPVTTDEASVGFAAEDSHDQDANSVDSEETTLNEPQPLQIIPFSDRHAIPRFERVLREESSFTGEEHSLSGISIGSQVPALGGTLAQDVESGGVADTEVLEVDTIPASDISLADKSGKASAAVEKEGVAHVLSTVASSSQTQSAMKRLIAKFEDFTAHFKFGAEFGGPMLSLLGNVLADMRRTSFKTLTESQILSWRSVVQDLIAVGFDLDFMLEHLRKMASKFFSKAIANEMKIVRDHISSLQSTLAVLASYQGELMSAVAASLEVDKVASPIDGLFD
uniref:Aminotransferase-like plant mobile domain-containing protein n=1 Tax=Fagus sylvatica TaxID=28930 RepID=A0A2N9IAP6_FAGSY